MKAKKSTINVELLLKVRDHILEEPRRLNMDVWLKKWGTNYPTEELPLCRTQGCIGGWALKLAHRRMPSDIWKIFAAAQRVLGLSFEQAQRLFHQIYWPAQYAKPFRYSPRAGETWYGYVLKKAQYEARLAARRIDAFIQSEGRK